MKINLFLLQFAVVIIIIFGGTFTIHYFRTRDFLFDQMIAAFAGFILLIFSLIWRKNNKFNQI